MTPPTAPPSAPVMHRLLHHLRRPLGLRLSAHPLELLGRIGLIRRELLHGIGRMRPPI